MRLCHCIFVERFQLSQTLAEIVRVVLENPHPHCPPLATISLSGLDGQNGHVGREYLPSRSLGDRAADARADVREAVTYPQSGPTN